MQPLTASNEVSNLERDGLMCFLFSTGAVETEGRATALQTTKESPHDQFKKNIRTYRNISHLSLERGSRRGCVRPGLANFTFFWA